MKNIILLALTSMTILGCTNLTAPENNEGERIKFKEQRGNYTIIEVDGVEYLSSTHGGLIKLEKKDAE